MKLKEYRKLKGWTQSLVAHMLDCSVPLISKIETERGKPSAELAEKIEILTDGAVPFKAQLLDR